MIKRIKTFQIHLEGFGKRIVNFCIVYIFLATIIAVEIMKCSEWSIVGVLEFVVRILYLYFLPIIYIRLLCMFEKWYEKKYDTLCYYNMQFQGEDRLRYAMTSLIPKEVKIIMAFLVLFIAFSILVKIIDLEKCIAIYEEIRTGVLKQDPIGIILGIYGFVIALFQWQKNDLDKKCMFFSVDDLPRVKKYGKLISISFIIIFGYIIFYFILSYMEGNKRWLYLIEGIWFLCFCYIVWGCIYMFYKQVDVEKRVLRKMDRYYGTEEILMLPQRTWYRGKAVSKLTDLMNRYKKLTNRIDIENIEEIDFGCVISDKHDNRKRAIKKYYLVAVLLGLSLMAVGYSLTRFMNEQMCCVYAVTMFIGALPIILMAFVPNNLAQNYKFINWLTYISSWGYYVKLRNKNTEIYVSSYSIVYSRYQKFLLELKRIICFYNLAQMMKYKDEDDFGKCGITDICAYILDMNQRLEKVDFMVIPLMICACLYKGDRKTVNSYLRETLKKISIKKDSKEKIMNICLLVLRDIHGDDITFREHFYKRKLRVFLRYV